MIPNGPYMDMHTHILPGLDDGSQTMECTKNMLRQAYDEGIRVIVATPHFGIRNSGFRLSQAETVLAETQNVADEIVPGLKLVLGNELFYSDGIAESLNRGEAKTIGGSKYALVEFSTRDSYDKINKCIRELSWNGYIPLIAHVERYRCLENDVGAVRTLVSQGAVIQVNCRSFMGGSNKDAEPTKKSLFGRKPKNDGFFLEDKAEWVRTLLKDGLVHLIASDCHDDGLRRPVYRSALEAMEPYTDAETLNAITKINVLKLIRNQRIV